MAVILFADINESGIQTDCKTEDDFVGELAEALQEHLDDLHNNGMLKKVESRDISDAQHDAIEDYIRHGFEIIASMRGYKTDVSQSVIRTSGLAPRSGRVVGSSYETDDNGRPITPVARFAQVCENLASREDQEEFEKAEKEFEQKKRENGAI